MVWWALAAAALVSTTPPTVPPTSPPVAPPSSVPAAPPTSQPAAAADPLGCTAVVHDPSDELDDERVATAAARLASALGADVHVRAERDLDGGLDSRMGQLEAQCPGWRADTGRAPSLLVVMYSSTEREASVFYGAALSAPLQFRWEHAVDEMGARFRAGDYSGGVVAGLDALQRDPPVEYEPPATPTAYAGDQPGSGIPPVMWFGVIALVGVAAVRVVQYLRTGEWSTADGSRSSRSSRWTSSSRPRRWSSSRARSSSGSRRSSGRAGGGTKKW